MSEAGATVLEEPLKSRARSTTTHGTTVGQELNSGEIVQRTGQVRNSTVPVRPIIYHWWKFEEDLFCCLC